MERLEVLSGPQGTLFGASSQAGVVRMITNKPVVGESASNVEVEYRMSPEGDPGNKVEAVTNIPLGDRSAVRFVAYKDFRGGYIDQVEGSLDVSGAARFRTAGTVKDKMVYQFHQQELVFKLEQILSGVTLNKAEAIVER